MVPANGPKTKRSIPFNTKNHHWHVIQPAFVGINNQQYVFMPDVFRQRQTIFAYLSRKVEYGMHPEVLCDLPI
jgi:hypothetical protein